MKKLPVVNLLNSSKIMRNDGKPFAISARKAGHPRFRQVTRWDSHDIDTATGFVPQNPETLDRLKTAEIEGYWIDYTPSSLK